jgi:hypothetical protein
MYFDFPTYLRVIWLVLTDKPSPKRLATHLGLLVLLSLWAVFNAIFLLLDPVFFPRLRSVSMEDPVFIVGNARSGTTLFHRLLCGDRERFAYFRMFELLFPSLIQKKVIRFLYFSLERRFPETHRRLVDWESRQLLELKRQHYIGVATPEEDEWLFLISLSSAMVTAFFPYVDALQYIVIFEQRPAATRKRILRFYTGCVKRQLLLDGEQLTLLSKNPAFVSKMRDLATEFPDAKFVYLVRNPFETIPSLLKLLQTILDGLGIESDHAEAAKRALVDGCIRDYYYALEVLAELPPERYAIVQYTDLVADPKASVEKVYERLQLKISPAFDEFLAGEQGRQKRYRSDNAYSLAEFAVDRAALEEKLAPLLERFGFHAGDPSESETREML